MKKIGSILKSIGNKIKSFFNNIRTKLKTWSENIKTNFKNRRSRNNNVQTNTYPQNNKNNQVEQDNNSYSFVPTENLNIYKPNTVEKNKTEQKSEQKPEEINFEEEEIQDDNNEQTQFTTEKISKIDIKEKEGEAQYTTVDGKVYTVDINKVLYNKKGIYKDFRISKKCKELTGSFFRGRKLEKTLNPLVIDGLNNEEDIDKYIKCVNDEETLFFDLQHNTQNSTLGIFDKSRMKNIAKIEEKLGANVQIDLGFFDKMKANIKGLFNKEKEQEGREERMIAKQYKQALKKLQKKSANTLYKGKVYAKIENTLTKCAEWYMNNGKFEKADDCLDMLSNMLDDKYKNFYLPKYNEAEKNGNQEYAIEYFAQEENIKRCDLEKLRIKRECLSGNKDVAIQQYNKMLQELNIALTQEELEKSIKNNGLMDGTYSRLITKMEQNPDGSYSMNNVFEKISIIGNEVAQAILSQLRNNKNKSTVTNTTKQEKQEKQQAEENVSVKEQFDNQMPEEQKENQQNQEQQNASEQTYIEQETESEVIPKSEEKKEIKAIDQEARREIVKLINRSNKLTAEAKYKQGAIVPLVNRMVNYLQENNDVEVQNRLNMELEVFQNLVKAPYVAGSNIAIWNYFHTVYKDGFQADDGRAIIEKDEKKWAYYLYIANKYTCQSKSSDIPPYWNISKEELEQLKSEYETNKEKVNFLYLNYLKEKNHSENATGVDRLIEEAKFYDELSEIKVSDNNSDYLNLSIAYENIARVNNRKNQYILRETIKSIEEKMKQGKKVENRAVELLGDIYFEGIKNNGSDEKVITPHMIQAAKVYSYIIENGGSDIAYTRLHKLYSDNTLPIYDKKQAHELEKKMKEKGIEYTERKNTQKKKETKSPCTYVCSDIHSEYAVYESMMKHIKDNDKLYILGDVIDRGPDGIKILQDIIERQEKGQVEFFVGNHEYMMIQSLFLNNQAEKENWENNNNGIITEKAYYALPIEQQEKIKQFLLNSLVYKELNLNGEKIYLVHAKAVNDSKKIQETVLDMINTGREQELQDAVWARERARKSSKSGEVWKTKDIPKEGTFTIIGHTPTYKRESNGINYDNHGVLYIDCGASYGEKEALIRLEDGNVLYFDTETERAKMKEKEAAKI